MTFIESLHPRDTGKFTTKSNSAPDGTLVAYEPEGEVWRDFENESDEDEKDVIRNYLGDFAADYSDDDIKEMGATYRLKIEARADAEGELNSDGHLVLPAQWLADMPEADWLDDINATIQDFDDARVQAPVRSDRLTAALARHAADYEEFGLDEDGFDFHGIDEEGFDDLGFNKDGLHKTTGGLLGPDKRDLHGFDARGFDLTGYDSSGVFDISRSGERAQFYKTFDRVYDADGFNPVTGLNLGGVNRHGQDKDGYTNGYRMGTYNSIDRDGRYENGTSDYDAEGFNDGGYDREHFNHDGLNRWRFGRDGLHVYTGRTVDIQGTGADGYDRQGFRQLGSLRDRGDWDVSGQYNRHGYDVSGRYDPKHDPQVPVYDPSEEGKD